MTVFKTFLKILNKNKFIIILYTVILVGFGAFNMQTSDNQVNFVASKPDILIINNDENKGITENFINYIKNNCNIVDIENNEESINDALFYRDVNYIIYIPKNFKEDILKGEIPEIEIKSTGGYQSSLAEMIVSRYLKTVDSYVSQITDESEIINKVNDTLNKETKIEVTSKLDTDSIAKASFYYNFASYSILAGTIYIICLILSSFNNEKVRKRTIISSMNYKKHNRILLVSNFLFAAILWLFYILLSFILIGDIMFSMQGLIFIANSFVFTICAVTMSFLISNLVNNKNAINGIVNVVALGSSFLCGAFVPVEYLPSFVLKIAHILPSYWYIQTNELLKKMEIFNLETLKPIFINMGVILIFALIFIIITNIVSKKKRKV